MISLRSYTHNNKDITKKTKDEAVPMSLPNDLKNHYVEWLQEFISALHPKQEQLALTYEKAKRNLLETDGIVYYPKDLRKVKGIGNTITKRLEKRLKEYCNEIGVNMPLSIGNADDDRGTKRGITVLRSSSTNINNSGPPAKKTRRYIPKKRSGGYGILLALLEANAITPKGISKDDTISLAQKYCDHSMNSNISTREFKGAWASITALRKHEFVFEEGRPKRYSLTEEGAKMAQILKSTDNIVFPQESGDSLRDYDNNSEAAESEFTANYNQLLGDRASSFDSGIPVNQDNSLLDITFQDTGSSPEVKIAGITSIRGEHHFSSFESQYTSTSAPLGGIPISKAQTLRRRFQGTSYELWTRGNYEIFPVIDSREVKSQSDRNFFLKAFTRKGMKSEVRQLALGDIIWIAKNKTNGSEAVLNTIIERKRLDDLALSIKDNRFMEQKSRLDKSGCKNKYYLIEETMGIAVEGMAEALKTSIWIILLYYRFSIIRTINSDVTVERLHSLHTVLQEEYSKKDLLVIDPHNLRNQDGYRYELEKFRREFERTNDIECCHNFQCFQEILGKGELSTIGELTIYILMFIRGVSIEKAVAIQSMFPTLNHILTAYAECESVEEANLLMFNKLGSAPGVKKISKNLSETIADVFRKF